MQIATHLGANEVRYRVNAFWGPGFGELAFHEGCWVAVKGFRLSYYIGETLLPLLTLSLSLSLSIYIYTPSMVT